MVCELLALIRDPIALVRYPFALGHRTLTPFDNPLTLLQA
jgi:hypothetical protein